MSIKDIIVSSYQVLVTWRKRKLVKAAQVLRDRYKKLLERNNELSEKIKGSEEGISTLYEENKRLKEAIDRKKIISTEKAKKPLSKGRITNTGYQKLVETTKKTVNRYLHDLADKEIMDK